MKTPLLCLLIGWPVCVFAHYPDALSSDMEPPARLKAAVEHRFEATVKVHPGHNTEIPIALGHLNRIVLPFDNPEIRTVNAATTELKGRVLYVAPTDDQPVTLYITEAEEEEEAISLTLTPEAIPPREVYLDLPRSAEDIPRQKTLPTHQPETSQKSLAEASTTGDPVKSVKRAFKAIAMGEMPTGFRLRKPSPDERLELKGVPLEIKTGQVLVGDAFEILIGVVKNTGKQAIDIQEASCRQAGRSILAAALWPRTQMAPGSSSELYVAVKPRKDLHKTPRPYLLTGRT